MNVPRLRTSLLRSFLSGFRGRVSPGFTLLEVLIALAILGLSLAVVFQTFSDNLRRMSDAGLEATAVSVGQSLLAQFGRELPLRAGSSRGEFEGAVAWQVDIAPYEHDAQMNGRAIGAMKVVVTVTWPGGESHRLQLTTIRLGE